MQTQVTLAGDSHTQSAMCKHLDTNQFASRTGNLLFNDLLIDFGNLLQVQLTGQHHHIGKLGIELQRLHIRNIQLGRKMYLLSDTVRITHGSHIRRNDGRDFRRLRRIDNLAHQSQVFPVNNRIDRQITFNPVFLTDRNNLAQIVCREIIGRTRTHVQSFNAEVDRVGTSLNSRHQRFIRTYRRHYFKIFFVQSCLVLN